MPIRKVPGGYKFGNSGKTYPTRAGAEKQMKAMFANGYRGDANEKKVKAKSKRKPTK